MHIFLPTWFNFEFLSFCITCRLFFTLFVILFVFKHRYIKTIFSILGLQLPLPLDQMYLQNTLFLSGLPAYSLTWQNVWCDSFFAII